MHRNRGARLALVLLAGAVACQSPAGPDGEPPLEAPPTPEQLCAPVEGSVGTRHDGYRGIWFMDQPQADEYRYKYSGGFATYPQQHVPIAVYAPAVHRTYFVYGGREKDRNTLTNMVSYYDHATGEVPQPVSVVSRGTDDAHFNPTLAVDNAGYVYVFANIHGHATADAHIFRSTCPYSISAFKAVRTERFSYSQVWTTSSGMTWLHTRYSPVGYRQLFWSSSADGITWADPRPLVQIERGSYQISWAQGDRVGTAFDFHPYAVGLNARTNVYYLETRDQGATWTTAAGQAVSAPLTAVNNPALVHDYKAEGLMVYLKDMKYDAQGRPVILYLTTSGYVAGPASGTRTWRTARWTGSQWVIRDVAVSDHNYDHGSLYLEEDGGWRVVAPLAAGAQPYMTGGDVVVLRSGDQGLTWVQESSIASASGRNASYVRGPFAAHPDFYALWADGDTRQTSNSSIYFATRKGEVFRLPSSMDGARVRPERAVSPTALNAVPLRQRFRGAAVARPGEQVQLGGK